MPIRVELPDGNIAEFPDGMTNEEIERVLAQQYGGGPTEQTAPEQVGQQPLPAIAAAPLEFMAGVNRGAAGLVDFASSLPNALLQLAGREERIPSLVEALSPATAGGFLQEGLGRDVAGAAGEVIPGALGAGGALRSAAQQLPRFGAAAEGTAPGVLREIGRATPAQDVGFGALSGAGGEVGQEYGGDVGQVLGAIAAPAAVGGLSSVAGALSKPARSELVETAADAGIPVLTSDVLPPKTFAGKMAQETAEKIPVAGTGGMREAQQEMRERAVSDIAEKYGSFSYDAIINSLKAQKDKVKRAAGSVMSQTGQKLDEVGTIPISNTSAAVDDAMQELSRPGILQSSEAGEEITNLIKTLQEAPQTFTTLRENRTAFREIIKNADKAERSQLTSRAKGLLEKVGSAMKQDMDTFAKENLTPDEFGKWQKANTVYAQEAQKLTKSRLKNVLDKGDMNPESVQTMLFSRKPSEVKTLYDSLTKEGRENARSAIISKVVGDLARRRGGITPNTFVSEMKKQGIQTDTFFKGDEKRQLDGLLKALDATRRAQDAALTTPTGQQLIGGLSVTGLAIDPITTLTSAGTVGGLARLYESAPVRNALLRLAAAKEGSSEFDEALSVALRSLAAESMTGQNEESDIEPLQGALAR